MKAKFSTPALALLLLAGAGGAGLAQDRDHEHSQAAPQGAPHPGGPPSGPPGGGHGGGPQGGGPRGGPPAGAPQGQGHEGRGFEGRGGPPQGGAPHPGFQGAPAGAPPQHIDRGPGPGPGPAGGGPRQFDHERGPREVIPPAADRGGARFDGRGGGGQVDGRNNPWGGRGARWQPGHAPPVFWSHDRFHAGGYRAPYGYYVRSWAFGDFLPRDWFGDPYFIGDFLDYDLPYPPPGFEWVRVGPDALMVDRYTGRIVQVVRGIFW
jgi:Ni/Co efflux regulator RcnB